MNYFQKYLLLFLRHSWLAVLIVAGAVGIAWMRVDKEPSVYGSTAVMEVVVGDKEILNIRDMQQDRINSMDAINTVVETLSSNDVMLQVADVIKRREEWAAGSPNGQVPEDKMNSLAQSVRNQIRVSLKRGTRLIEVVAEDGSPKVAQQIAEQVVTQFMDMQKDKAGKSSGADIKAVGEQEKELLDKLTEAKQARDEFARQKGIVITGNLQDAAAVAGQLALAGSKVAALESDVEAAKKVAGGDVDALLRIPAIAAIPEIASVRSAIPEREAAFAMVQERYLEKHPKDIAAAQALTDLKIRLATQAAGATREIEKQLQAAKSEQERLRTRGTNMVPSDAESQDNVTFQKLDRAVQENQRLYDALLSGRSELEVANKLNQIPYKWASRPLLNPVPLRPDRRKSMTDAGLIGLALAVGLILLLERLDSSIRTVDDAEKSLGVPVLSAVPEGDLSTIPKGGTVMTDAAGSAQAEAFRTLRASLSLTGSEVNRHLLLVTSAIPAEGKTFTSINLAACLAGQGYRTLLVDGDLRRPALSAALLPRDERKGEQYRGLTDILSGNSQPAECIRNSSVMNLSLLPAGRRAPNPSELLSQSTLPALLKYLQTHFDRIIFDSAPINAVSDTLGLASQMQSVIMVLRFGKTPKRAILRALQQLKKVGTKVSGVVMNRVPARRGAAYYYYFYGDPYLKDSVYGSADKKRKRKKVESGTPDPA